MAQALNLADCINVSVTTPGPQGASIDTSLYITSGQIQDLFLTTGEGDLRYLSSGSSGV